LFAFTHARRRWRAAVEPDYYGLAMFAQAAPPGARLLRVSPFRARQLKVWATRASDGTIRAVAINEGTSARLVVLRAPAGTLGSGTLERLEAPGIGATGRVTLAGQTFGAATGLPVGRRRIASVARRDGRYVFRVPASSAAMLTLS